MCLDLPYHCDINTQLLSLSRVGSNHCFQAIVSCNIQELLAGWWGI